jgi:hypothetical protein
VELPRSNERTEQIFAEFINIADVINLKPGMKIPSEEAANAKNINVKIITSSI